MSSHWKTIDTAIIGAGIGGASIACELARRGHPAVLLESEALPGAHASGRNASLILQNIADPVNRQLAMESAAILASPPDDFRDPPEFRRVGSLLLASGASGLDRMHRDVDAGRAAGLSLEVLTPPEAADRVPILDPSGFSGAVFCAGDGVVDIHRLLYAFLDRATAGGITLERQCRVDSIIVEGGAVAGLETSRGRIECRQVVNAAGPWALDLGRSIDAPLPLRPTRRHLIVTGPSPVVDADWPFVWDVDTPFYFRPESGGLLLCGCDIEDAEDCDETTRTERIQETCARASRLMPDITDFGVAHAWAGIRTLTPDDRFVIGPDPRIQGFFWLAGLGGHGIASSPAVGRIAADLLLEGSSEGFSTESLSPERFLGN